MLVGMRESGFRPDGRAPFARPKGAEKGGCHRSDRPAYGVTTALRCSPPAGGPKLARYAASDSRPAYSAGVCASRLSRRHGKPALLEVWGFRSRLNVAEHRSRRWISRRAAPSEAGMPKPLQSGQDGPSATPTGCEKRRAPAAAGGWPRSRAHFLFASFLCASKEKGLARQGETRGPAVASHLSRREGWMQIGLRTPHSHPQSPTARPPVQYP